MDLEEIHTKNLERIIHDLGLIDESPEHIHSIIREPKWYDEKTSNELSLCDLFLIYEDSSFRPIELKKCELKRDKGIFQLLQGFKFGVDELGVEWFRPGKLVYYGGGSIRSEEIEIPTCYQERDISMISQNMYII